MTTIPRIVSADDHVVEPADVFTSRLPAKYREVGPRIVRAPVAEMTFRGGNYVTRMGSGRPGDDGPLADWWLYEDLQWPHTRLGACAGFSPEDVQVVPMTYDEMRPGCWHGAARLEDMDRNWVEASLCFPTFPRFCGQTFLEATDKDLALRCVELCGVTGYGERELLEKWARDAKILDIFEGTQQIQQLIVARRVLGLSSSELK